MKNKSILKWIIPLIFLMSLLAAGTGLFWETDGQPYPYTSIHGEAVTINGHGLYSFDTVSTTAQMQANDIVTLVLGLPLLAISTWLAFRGSLRGRLLLTGTLGFFLYTYMSMTFNTAYNPFFMLYTALFSLSLFAFIITMMTYDLKTLPQHFSEKLPRRAIAGLLFSAALFLFFTWVGGLILPTLLLDQTPSFENTTTMVIQVMDLGLIVPLAFLSGYLLLRRKSWGYLLASVSVMKFLTMGAAVSAMAINMALNDIEVSVIELTVFPALTLANVVMAFFLLKNLDSRPMTALPA